MDDVNWEALVAAANADPETRLALKNAQFRVAVEIGEDRVLLAADDGAIQVAEPSTSADFELRGSRGAWERYAAAQGTQTNSIMSMARQGHLSKDGRVASELGFDGDQRKLWANFRAIDLVLQQLREGRG